MRVRHHWWFCFKVIFIKYIKYNVIIYNVNAFHVIKQYYTFHRGTYMCMSVQKTIMWKNIKQTHDYEYQKGTTTYKREGKIKMIIKEDFSSIYSVFLKDKKGKHSRVFLGYYFKKMLRIKPEQKSIKIFKHLAWWWIHLSLLFSCIQGWWVLGAGYV